jgi:enoyl-CoA hydratase
MGLGANFALLTDVVVAARSATFADTHVRMGIGAGDGGQVIWPLLMGVNRAKYFLMTGDRVSAEEAERLGLVNFVVEDQDLMTKALEIAERLARGPGRTIAASKVPINKYLKMVSNLVLPPTPAKRPRPFARSASPSSLVGSGPGEPPRTCSCP